MKKVLSKLAIIPLLAAVLPAQLPFLLTPTVVGFHSIATV
jgi:hypothetical protein